MLNLTSVVSKAHSKYVKIIKINYELDNFLKSSQMSKASNSQLALLNDFSLWKIQSLNWSYLERASLASLTTLVESSIEE